MERFNFFSRRLWGLLGPSWRRLGPPGRPSSPSRAPLGGSPGTFPEASGSLERETRHARFTLVEPMILRQKAPPRGPMGASWGVLWPSCTSCRDETGTLRPLGAPLHHPGPSLAALFSAKRPPESTEKKNDAVLEASWGTLGAQEPSPGIRRGPHPARSGRSPSLHPPPF